MAESYFSIQSQIVLSSLKAPIPSMLKGKANQIKPLDLLSYNINNTQCKLHAVKYQFYKFFKKEKVELVQQHQQGDGNQMSEIQFHIPIHLIHSNDFPKK